MFANLKYMNSSKVNTPEPFDLSLLTFGRQAGVHFYFLPACHPKVGRFNL